MQERREWRVHWDRLLSEALREVRRLGFKTGVRRRYQSLFLGICLGLQPHRLRCLFCLVLGSPLHQFLCARQHARHLNAPSLINFGFVTVDNLLL